ncbi:MAG TPA: thioredoxin family protein [Aggregatilineales bacterium]|nr:thioredoxin family protein [Aggregatilineales bacterium]HPV06582.1 thioredoxin family protein [Aggregatilineales bacterium]HQA67758.1 thioredoxin family protein [Aggregatilineales bacterium]HQE17617.1 thioredoxin family protein [Aggregatilineales bacterium]
MPLLDEKTRRDVQEMLADIAGPARLVVFTQPFECDYCKETREIVEEIAELSDQISVEVYDFQDDAEVARKYNVDKIPAIVLLGADGKDYGVRYYGIPSGYEFSSLLHDIKAVAAGPEAVELSDETRAFLDSLKEDVHLQVFVTPTCPYCPRAVVLAHAMAIASDRVRADMVEATEFPHLSMKYNVMGVPRTVINDREFVEGAVPEYMLVDAIRAAVR